MFELALKHLLFKFNREESLHLVGELLTIVDVELLGRKFVVVVGEVTDLALKLNVAREKHKWALDVGAVRREDLVHSRNEVIFLKMERVALGDCKDCFFVLDPQPLNLFLDVALDSVEQG